MQVIPSDIFNATVDGPNLRPGTLADQLGDEPTLLVLLRHFGCPFCRETIEQLKKLSAADPAYPPVLFVCQSGSAEARDFFATRWAEARVICDPDKTIYTAMGLRRGTPNQIFGVRVWACTFRALVKGHFLGPPVGDPWLMPGVFLVRGERILWMHEFQHQGDHPDWAAIPGRVNSPQRHGERS